MVSNGVIFSCVAFFLHFLGGPSIQRVCRYVVHHNDAPKVWIIYVVRRKEFYKDIFIQSL